MPNYKFHEKFRKRDTSLGALNRSQDMLNNPSVNDALRTRPTKLAQVAAQNADYVPSIQKYNRRGKLY